MLLRAQFESPVRETRARTELLQLTQRKGENASTYMARTKSLLHRVPGYDMKTALQQWILGLRQPYRLEAAKANPKTLSEAELLISRLEDAYEFSNAAKGDNSQQKGAQGKSEGKQQDKKKNPNKMEGKSGGNWDNKNKVQQGSASRQQNQQNRGQQSNRGQGQAGQSRPPQQTGPTFHQGNQSGGSGHRGRGMNQRKPRVAVMATNLREMADQLDREVGQQPTVSEEVSPRQRQGN